MRLIDAEALKTGINFSVTITGKDNAVEVKRLMELYNKAIDNAPTIDIAEVCGECKPYEPCIYCIHEFENMFETCGAKMDKGGDTE